MAPSRAVFAPEHDDLQVQAPPVRLGKDALEVAFSAFHGGSVRKAPARGQAVDVRVHGERRLTEGLGHDHTGRLMADAGQGLKLREGAGHLAAVALTEQYSQARQGACLLGRQAEGTDDLQDLALVQFSQGGRIRCPPKELRRDHVYTHIGRLGREQNGDK